MITLQFVGGGGDLGSRLIEWFGHGAKYSHVDTVWPDGRLFGARSDTIDGISPGVQYRPADYVGSRPTLRIELPADDAMTVRYHDSLREELGKPYDKLAILAFFLNRSWRDDDAWFCDELVAAKLEACGWFEHPLAFLAHRMTPGDLLLAISVKVPIKL